MLPCVFNNILTLQKYGIIMQQSVHQSKKIAVDIQNCPLDVDMVWWITSRFWVLASSRLWNNNVNLFFHYFQ